MVFNSETALGSNRATEIMMPIHQGFLIFVSPTQKNPIPLCYPPHLEPKPYLAEHTPSFYVKGDILPRNLNFGSFLLEISLHHSLRTIDEK